MGKYFNHNDIDLIESEEVVKLLNRADKHPDRFIRITLNQNGMHLDNKSKAEFEIFQAVIFIWDADCNIYRYDFHQNDPDRCFYAAIDPQNLMAMSLQDPQFPREKLCMFDGDDVLLGMLKTADSTIFVIYDGSSDHAGYGFYLEKEGYPSIFEKLLSLFEISRQGMSEQYGRS